MTHNFCYECSEKLKLVPKVTQIAVSKWHRQCESCDTTLFDINRPSLCADMAILHENKILLIKRAKGHNIGRWATPGGHVEPNEHPIDAAVRECVEETKIASSALSPTTIEMLGIYLDLDVGVPNNVVIAYRARFSSRPNVELTDETEGYGWFTMTELSSLLVIDVAMSIAIDAFTVEGRYK